MAKKQDPTIVEQVQKVNEQIIGVKHDLTQSRAENHLYRQWISEHGGDPDEIVGVLRCEAK